MGPATDLQLMPGLSVSALMAFCPMAAALVLGGGLVAVMWHLVPMLLHRPPAWIAWWCLHAMASRFLIVWLYNNTGRSVCAVALFHATLNLSYMLFPRKQRHSTVAAAATGLGALALVVAVALPMLAPVFRFAPPTGPYAFGTLVYHWVDVARSEAFGADPKARRQVMVQIWYPAQAHSPGPPAAYMPDADAVTAAFARIHDKPAFVFGHFKYVTTHARWSVPAAADRPGYPLLIFLQGATGFRQMNTFQVEHLVSHGYIVAASDQPGAAAAVVFPDGHQAAGLTLTQFRAMVPPSYMPGAADPLPKGALLPSA